MSECEEDAQSTTVIHTTSPRSQNNMPTPNTSRRQTSSFNHSPPAEAHSSSPVPQKTTLIHTRAGQELYLVILVFFEFIYFPFNRIENQLAVYHSRRGMQAHR
eukprot:g40311.t1